MEMLTPSGILGQTFRYKISTLTLCHTLPLFPEAALISISPPSLRACEASVARSGSPTIKQPGECGMSSFQHVSGSDRDITGYRCSWRPFFFFFSSCSTATVATAAMGVQPRLNSRLSRRAARFKGAVWSANSLFKLRFHGVLWSATRVFFFFFFLFIPDD